MTERTRVSLCADLLRTIINDNKELLMELQLRNALGNYESSFPVLGDLKMGDDLTVDAATMPDTDNSVAAMAHIIRKVQGYMEIFIGGEEAEMRIYESVNRFRELNSIDIQNAGLSGVLQEFLRVGRREAFLDFDHATDMEKARALFLDIFNQFLADDPVGWKAQKYIAELTGCDALKDVSGDGTWFEFAEGATFTSVVEQLSAVVERLEVPLDVIERVFDEYGRMAEDLGVKSTLFQGALSAETKFGVESIDDLMRGGLGRDLTLLLEGPAVVERDLLSCLFLKHGLEEKGCVVVVSTLSSPERLRKGLESIGLGIQALEAEGRLIIVDWYTRHLRQITGIEEEGSVIRVSNDLTNLAVGIDIALRKAAEWPTRRLVLDFVSPTIMIEGFDRVNDFLNSLKAKLKNFKCTGLVTLNPGMHSHEDIDIMEDLFDGTLSLSRITRDGRIHSELHLSSYSGGPFSSSRIHLDINESGLAVSDAEHGFTGERIHYDHNESKFTLGFPGIENIATGGLPQGQSYLIWVSSKMTSAEVIRPLIIEALGQGHGLVLALSTVTSNEVSGWLGEHDFQLSTLIAKGVLEIVDWQAQKDSRILGVEEVDGVLRASKDITHLGVAIDLALRRISVMESSVAIFETHSPAFRIFDLRTVYPFVQTMNARLDKRGFTTFVVMDRGAHDSKVSAGIEELFDGVLDVMDAGDHLELAVQSLSNAHFIPEYRQLQRLRSGFSVDVTPREPAAFSPLAEDIDARIERLSEELNEALVQKQKLEKRTREFMEREVEWQARHDELRIHLTQLEEQINEQQKALIDVAGKRYEDDEHRREVSRILALLDGLLESLPEDMIERFANSEEFKLYEKILDIYKEGEDDTDG
jgi:KaiC/GvpD/RAD55 family RecA-like ATPase